MPSVPGDTWIVWLPAQFSWLLESVLASSMTAAIAIAPAMVFKIFIVLSSLLFAVF
jgi:hypothetical protein